MEIMDTTRRGVQSRRYSMSKGTKMKKLVMCLREKTKFT